MLKKVRDIKRMVLSTLEESTQDFKTLKKHPWEAVLPFNITKIIVHLASIEPKNLPPALLGENKKMIFVYGALRSVVLYQSLEGINARFLKWYYGVSTGRAIPKDISDVSTRLEKIVNSAQAAATAIYEEVLALREGEKTSGRMLENVRQLYYAPLRLEFSSIAPQLSRGCKFSGTMETRWRYLDKHYLTLGSGAVLGFVKELYPYCKQYSLEELVRR